MKNWEYYKDELEKVNYRFAILHNGTFVACEDVATCIDCEFCVAGIGCGNEAIKFLCQEHDEPIKQPCLTNQER